MWKTLVTLLAVVLIVAYIASYEASSDLYQFGFQGPGAYCGRVFENKEVAWLYYPIAYLEGWQYDGMQASTTDGHGVYSTKWE